MNAASSSTAETIAASARSIASPTGLIAGVDVGGTKIAVTVADAGGILVRRFDSTPLSGPPDTIGHCIQRLLQSCLADIGRAGIRVDALGVASCGPFARTADGLALAAPNLCGGLSVSGRGENNWTSIPIEASLRDLAATVRIENDAVAALVAEHRLGVLRRCSHAAYVTWSTGIGVGLMVDGRILKGKTGNAGHAGHMTFAHASGPGCGCGNQGDVESVSGGAALARQWGKPVENLFAEASRGNPQARALIYNAIEHVSAMIYNLIVTLDLERIAIGGGLFQAQQAMLLPALQAGVFNDPSRRGLSALTGDADIQPVHNARNTADLAALCLVMPDSWQDESVLQWETLQ